MKLHRRKHSAFDNTTWEFPRAGWIATHALAIGGIWALVRATSRHYRD